MNYKEVIADCNKRMKLANHWLCIGGDYEVSRTTWLEAYERKGSAIEALLQQRKVHYTNCGSADLRLPR